MKKKLVLRFPHNMVDQPIICYLVRDYNLTFNILKAYVSPDEEGHLVLELDGADGDYKKGIKYLEDKGVKIELLSKDVKRNEEKCIHCGACITICPTDAFTIDQSTRKVDFDGGKCIACELCVPGCPYKAMEVQF